eukprot:1124446-Pleurochrysis_carterae.AAC.1
MTAAAKLWEQDMAELRCPDNIRAMQAHFELEYDIDHDPKTSDSEDEINRPHIPYENIWPSDDEYNVEAWEWRMHKSNQRWERRCTICYDRICTMQALADLNMQNKTDNTSEIATPATPPTATSPAVKPVVGVLTNVHSAGAESKRTADADADAADATPQALRNVPLSPRRRTSPRASLCDSRSRLTLGRWPLLSLTGSTGN